ncbi:unnamed protein product, partial [marine sediment metagenome]
DNSYLNNWRRILKSSQNWSFTKEDKIGLEELMKDLESED